LESIILYSIALVLLGLSFSRDAVKSKQALNKAWQSLWGILPDFLGVLGLVGLVLTLLPPQFISGLLGKASGALGMVLAAAIGSITLIPGFIAFPLAKSLLDAGAGYQQIAVFVTTLMAVGFVTAPLEIRYFGRKETILRNGLSFIWAFVIAVIIGVTVR
jgi:uncharacterized membrane protein YraQ (UPF0718 family)